VAAGPLAGTASSGGIKSVKFRFIADEPTKQDTLGFEEFVERIYESLQETSTPFVYGLLGPWGSGKTSSQRMLETRFNRDLDARRSKLESERRVGTCKLYVPVWFDAWKYENQTSMIFPLLHAFRLRREDLLEANDAPGFGAALRDAVLASTVSVLDIGLRVATRAAFGEAIKLKDIKEQLDLVQQDKDPIEDALQKWVESVDGLT
jgi:hypothetical protein